MLLVNRGLALSTGSCSLPLSHAGLITILLRRPLLCLPKQYRQVPLCLCAVLLFLLMQGRSALSTPCLTVQHKLPAAGPGSLAQQYAAKDPPRLAAASTQLVPSQRFCSCKGLGTLLLHPFSTLVLYTHRAVQGNSCNSMA